MSASPTISRKATSTQWFSQFFLLLFFQTIFFFMIGLSLYAIVTLNYQLFFVLAVSSILQSFAKRSQTVINLVNKYVKPTEYFRSFKRIYCENIEHDRAALFCFHPHSVLAYCLPANMNADDSLMSQMTGLASRFLLSLPFTGLQLRWWGVEAVNPENIKRLMKNRKPLGLIPGGFEEATLTTPKEIRLFIKNRKGFIKYALDYEYTIYPVLTYNEHKAFATFDYFTNFRLWMTKFKIPSVIFGMGFLWLYLPLNLELITVVGRGINRKPENVGKKATPEEVDQSHQEYMKEIERMHLEYQNEHGSTPLVFY